MGHPGRAFEQINEAVNRANELNHPFSIVYATYFSAIVHQLEGNTEQTLQLANLTMQLSRQYEFSFWQETAAMLSNWALFEQTGNNELISQFERDLQNYLNRGSRLALSFLYTLLVRMLIKANRLEDADIIIEKAISNLHKCSEHFFQAEIYRLKGEVSWKKDNRANSDTEVFFNEAMVCAQQQSATSLELRTAVSFSEYLIDCKQNKKARTILTDTMSRLTESKPEQEYKKAGLLLEVINESSPTENTVETV